MRHTHEVHAHVGTCPMKDAKGFGTLGPSNDIAELMIGSWNKLGICFPGGPQSTQELAAC
jgi:hypothetical protein